jgi:hypothetical protein
VVGVYRGAQARASHARNAQAKFRFIGAQVGSAPSIAQRWARRLVMDPRVPGDNAFYPDDDLIWIETEEGGDPANEDGTRY